MTSDHLYTTDQALLEDETWLGHREALITCDDLTQKVSLLIICIPFITATGGTSYALSYSVSHVNSYTDL